VTTVRSFWHEADARQVAQSIDVPLKNLSPAGDLSARTLSWALLIAARIFDRR
jgi:hypothetical protein